MDPENRPVRESLGQPSDEGKDNDRPQHVRKPERATLGLLECGKVDSWLKQINESTKGFLTLTRSDVVNFLIREHRDDLLPKELQRLRAANYDPIRHINWITQELKIALASGDSKMVACLQEEIKGIELAVVATAKVVTPERAAGVSPSRPKPNRKRVKRADNPLLSESLSIADLQEHLPEA